MIDLARVGFAQKVIACVIYEAGDLSIANSFGTERQVDAHGPGSTGPGIVKTEDGSPLLSGAQFERATR